MNILYLTHRVPFPPNKGDKLRAFRQIEHLAKRHRVWCACFLDASEDEESLEPLTADCQEIAAVRLDRRWAALRGFSGLVSGRTVTESFYAEPAMGQVVRRWAAVMPFDGVVAFSSSMAPYALQVPAERRILDLCDLDSRKWLDYAAASRGLWRWLYGMEGCRLAAREKSWIGVFDATLLITPAEANALRAPIPSGRIHIVGNGVTLPDLERNVESARLTYASSAKRSSGKSPPGRAVNDTAVTSYDRPLVGFVGVMDYRPNVDAVTWFVESCWRRIRAACPKAVFRIVGQAPTRRVRRLAKVPGVEVTGAVEDMAAEVKQLTVSVAPMRIARGLQNKVLEAMAAAKPVVLTRRAAEGIGAQNDREYLVADTAQDFIEKVIRLLHDPQDRERIGAAGRRFAAANHCWEGELQKFELIVTGVLRPKTMPIDLVSTRDARRIEEETVAAVAGPGM